MSIILEHKGQRPKIHPSAYVAPNATICGDVTLGEGCRVLFGATLVAEGNPVVLGKNCLIEENALIKATSRHSVAIGDSVVIGVGVHLAGCTIEDNSFFGSGRACSKVHTSAAVRWCGSRRSSISLRALHPAAT